MIRGCDGGTPPKTNIMIRGCGGNTLTSNISAHYTAYITPLRDAAKKESTAEPPSIPLRISTEAKYQSTRGQTLLYKTILYRVLQSMPNRD
jgi:hypothetical protein